MEAAVIMLLIGLLAAVLGVAEIRRAAQHGPAAAVAGILFTLFGGSLLVIAAARLLAWS